MRERAGGFIADSLGINTVYGVNAIGTRVCVYILSQETRNVVGPAVIRNQQYWNIDTAPPPIEWWNFDVLSPEGEHLREAVAHVKAMCAQL